MTNRYNKKYIEVLKSEIEPLINDYCTPNTEEVTKNYRIAFDVLKFRVKQLQMIKNLQ
jgi:hypothetical protein